MFNRTIARSVLLSLTLAACGAAAPSPFVAPSVTPATPSPSVSSAPQATQSPLAAPSPTPTFDLPHGAPALEAALPREFDGKPLFSLSFGPAELANNPAGPTIFKIVESAGGDASKAALAFANNAPAGTFNVLALSGPGADGEALVDSYAAATIAAGESLSASNATLGGREVTRLVSPASNPLGDVWVYAVGDVLYGVQSKDEALAAELIAVLP